MSPVWSHNETSEKILSTGADVAGIHRIRENNPFKRLNGNDHY
jgi:hypothetical protein